MYSIGTYQGEGLFENDSDKKILLIGLLASLRGKLLAIECNKINPCSIGKISDKYKYEAFWWRMIIDYDMNALNRYIMGKERQCKAYPNYISFQNQAQTQEKNYFDKKCVGTIYWQALDCLYAYINLFLYFVSISKG